MGAMVDVHDPDDSLLVVDAQQDPVVAVAGCVQTSQVTGKRLSQSVRVACQAAVHVSQHCVGDLAGKPGHVAPRGRCPLDAVTQRSGSPSWRRSSSLPIVSPEAIASSASAIVSLAQIVEITRYQRAVIGN
jgi:hypothetical protein